MSKTQRIVLWWAGGIAIFILCFLFLQFIIWEAERSKVKCMERLGISIGQKVKIKGLNDSEGIVLNVGCQGIPQVRVINREFNEVVIQADKLEVK